MNLKKISNALIILLQGILFILSIIMTYYFSGEWLTLITFIFLGVAGVAEYIFMNNFWSKAKRKFRKKEAVKRGFLWVHANIYYIQEYNEKIYDFDKIGGLPSIISYLIIFIYIFIGNLLFQYGGYYGSLVYIVPVITNLYFIWKNNYLIIN